MDQTRTEHKKTGNEESRQDRTGTDNKRSGTEQRRTDRNRSELNTKRKHRFDT